ncbi:NADH-quinone oxidoreductase [uncultured Desulfobacterium sp.]|uniref:NADH-quinone oxidoreductase n=1 Tax=uncultured Desulfobacterium sp. TaxID=201089 RepID=A0A445MRX5_9BACT|nr:NADH-quinone oxidoreductase [uncultured Desulfobacterium sp.]
MNSDWFKGLNLISVSKMSPEKTGLAYSVYLGPDHLLDAARRLYDLGCFIEDISVVDAADGFMVVYHFDHFTSPGRIALRVLAPHDKPEVSTISEVFSGANWHERECHDFFGVSFTGHPNMTPLLMPDDAGFHPLLKEDGKRKRMSEFISPGDVIVKSPEFDAIFAPAEPEEGSASDDKVAAKAGADKTAGSSSEA